VAQNKNKMPEKGSRGGESTGRQMSVGLQILSCQKKGMDIGEK